MFCILQCAAFWKDRQFFVCRDAITDSIQNKWSAMSSCFNTQKNICCRSLCHGIKMLLEDLTINIKCMCISGFYAGFNNLFLGFLHNLTYVFKSFISHVTVTTWQWWCLQLCLMRTSVTNSTMYIPGSVVWFTVKCAELKTLEIDASLI